MKATITYPKGKKVPEFLKEVTQKQIGKLSAAMDGELLTIEENVLNKTRRFINESRQRPQGSKESKFDIFEGKMFKRISLTENLFNTLSAGSVVNPDIGKLGVTGVTVGREGTSIRLKMGDIDFLNKHAPYWQLIDKGGKSDGMTHYGYFGSGHSPRAIANRQRKEVWTETGPNTKGAFWMIPKTTITPMKYIREMRKIFSEEVTKALVRVKRNTTKK